MTFTDKLDQKGDLKFAIRFGSFQSSLEAREARHISFTC